MFGWLLRNSIIGFPGLDINKFCMMSFLKHSNRSAIHA